MTNDTRQLVDEIHDVLLACCADITTDDTAAVFARFVDEDTWRRVAQRVTDRISSAGYTILPPEDRPRHVIDLREDGWTIQHPLSCRPDLFACPVNKAAEQWTAPPRRLSGHYEVRLNDAGDELVIGARVDPPDVTS